MVLVWLCLCNRPARRSRGWEGRAGRAGGGTLEATMVGLNTCARARSTTPVQENQPTTTHAVPLYAAHPGPSTTAGGAAAPFLPGGAGGTWQEAASPRQLRAIKLQELPIAPRCRCARHNLQHPAHRLPNAQRCRPPPGAPHVRRHVPGAHRHERETVLVQLASKCSHCHVVRSARDAVRGNTTVATLAAEAVLDRP